MFPAEGVKTPTPQKRIACLCTTVKCIYGEFFSGVLVDVEYPFVAITKSFTV